MGIRSHHIAGEPTGIENYFEPEYTAFSTSEDRVFVGLQENNAVATFNLDTNTWESVSDLGIREITIDPSDRDGASFTGVTVFGAPMPDSMATFTDSMGRQFLVTANEGDARGDDLDTVEIRDSPYTSIPVDPGTGLPYETDHNLVGGIGRLGLIDNLSDPDGDDIADQLVSYGTRDIILWEIDPSTGELTYHNSFDLEEYVLGEDPTRHNANDGGDPGEIDKRSDNKGPEPEALDVYVAKDGTVYILVANERQNGLVLIDATDPDNLVALDYRNDQPDGLLSPESIQLVEIDGKLTAIVGYEAFDANSGGIGVYAIPEPSSFLMMMFSGVFAVTLRRRK